LPHSQSFPIRPWQFVLEPLRGYLRLAERLEEDRSAVGSAWNFGPAEGDAKPVSWIANRLVNLWVPALPGALMRQIIPTRRIISNWMFQGARTALGWEPLVPLANALDWTLDWYRGFQSGADLECVTRSQIEQYEKLAVN